MNGVLLFPDNTPRGDIWTQGNLGPLFRPSRLRSKGLNSVPRAFLLSKSLEKCSKYISCTFLGLLPSFRHTGIHFLGPLFRPSRLRSKGLNSVPRAFLLSKSLEKCSKYISCTFLGLLPSLRHTEIHFLGPLFRPSR